ncbi:MAG: pyrroloquinoline quinone biosynthesis protein PqqE, partial [Pseudomonadota bacterium]
MTIIAPKTADGVGPTNPINPPVAMLAELTHRCPLSCPYCSNPLELVKRSGELSTETWLTVFRQAAAMGVLQLHLSGGEPAARHDLVELVAGAAKAGLYTNLITSGVGLHRPVFDDAVAAGLDHIQLSIQATDAETSDYISGFKGGLAIKRQVAGWVTKAGLPLTINAVMHRHNLDQIGEIIALAHGLGARRLEIAHAQHHGWGLKNRDALMPSLEQVHHAIDVVGEAKTRLKGQLAIDYVPPDHFAAFPKACMGGWGRMGLTITPAGKVLPCHSAETIPHLDFNTVQDRPLAEIWQNGQAFQAYRGTDWMPDICQSCERMEIDWGGCRCQALALAGDASATDPVC